MDDSGVRAPVALLTTWSALVKVMYCNRRREKRVSLVKKAIANKQVAVKSTGCRNKCLKDSEKALGKDRQPALPASKRKRSVEASRREEKG